MMDTTKYGDRHFPAMKLLALFFGLFLQEFLDVGCQYYVRLLFKVACDLGQKEQSGVNDRINGSDWYSSIGALDHSQLGLCFTEKCDVLLYVVEIRANPRPTEPHGCHDVLFSEMNASELRQHTPTLKTLRSGRKPGSSFRAHHLARIKPTKFPSLCLKGWLDSVRNAQSVRTSTMREYVLYASSSVRRHSLCQRLARSGTT